ncbi:MAG: toprim domain-containing protein [Steroidobacteraceae bacterium]|nr:toprim domain-containing protein [Steroidobacteraceae bacterium]
MAITTDERGTISFCHRCHYWRSEWRAACRKCGTLFELVSDPDGTIGTCPHCGDTSARTERLHIEPTRVTRAEPLDWSPRAEAIWRRTRPLAGSLGEVYLRHRGCRLPPADGDLRYLPPTGSHPPTLCARVTDAVTARPLSLHFTRLAPDGRSKAGTGRDKLLLAGHRKRGGVIRLWPDEAVTYGLGIAEGIETALAAARLYTPVWACIDAGNLAALPVLPGIECLAIYADHDDAGTRAAQECARRRKAADREVVIYRPRMRGEDIADLAQRRVA